VQLVRLARWKDAPMLVAQNEGGCAMRRRWASSVGASPGWREAAQVPLQRRRLQMHSMRLQRYSRADWHHLRCWDGSRSRGVVLAAPQVHERPEQWLHNFPALSPTSADCCSWSQVGADAAASRSPVQGQLRRVTALLAVTRVCDEGEDAPAVTLSSRPRGSVVGAWFGLQVRPVPAS